MRTVFVGASRFGLRCLETVLAMPACDVVGILTLPETFSISYRPEGVQNVLHADFHPVTARHGIPLHVMTGSMNDPELVERFRAWNPDLILVVGWYHLVPKTLRDIAPVLGMHASLLPDYSGGAPLVWAIINGEKKTGITLFRFDDGVDSGPIVDQAEEPIFDDDTIATLYARIEERGFELLARSLPALAAGTAAFRPQDPARRKVYPQRSPEHGAIDWSWPARKVYDFIRAQTRPYPGAFSSFEGNPLKIWRAAVRGPSARSASTPAPGQIDAASRGSDALVVYCGGAAPLTLTELEYSGAVMDGGEFFELHVARAIDANGSIRLGG